MMIFTRKPHTKSDILDTVESMKQLNDALLEEVKNNEIAISILEDKEKKYLETITRLEDSVENLRRETSPKAISDFQTQTSLDPAV